MIIDDINYRLSSSNYVEVESIKKQIVLGNTFNSDMKHFIGWKHRYNGEFKRTSAYTISKNGMINEHFEPKFQSRFFNNKELDKKSIVILLENDGYLINDSEKNKYINWLGDIYNSTDIVERRWRGYSFWCPYTKEQFESTVYLVKTLCKDFFIPQTVIGHNTKIEDLSEYEGVLYKGNIDKNYTDLSPAWDFEEFKTKIEEYEREH